MNAVLIIDVQKALIGGAHRIDEVIEAINLTIAKIRKESGLVVFIQHHHISFEAMKKGAEGWELAPRLDLQKNDVIIDKQASDSFYQSSLDEVLKSNAVEQVYITGMQTEYCVDATTRSALSKGYKVTLVSDAHTTGDSHMTAGQVVDHHNRVLANLAHPTEKIRVISSSDI